MIELLVVFSVIATLSAVGVASFVTYNKKQTLQTGVNEFITYLTTAKQRTQSQVVESNGTNMCAPDSFSGYEVDVGPGREKSTCEYEMDITCGSPGNNSSAYNPIVKKNFPNKVCVTPVNYVQFLPLRGGAVSATPLPQTFYIHGDGYGQTVTVTSDGNIISGTVGPDFFACPVKPNC